MTYDQYLVSYPYITGANDRKCRDCGKPMSRFDGDGKRCDDCLEDYLETVEHNQDFEDFDETE